jgi:dsDNA-specific endonuclease/ATPase MutS2
MTPFARGDRVHIPGLGSGVVREVHNGGRYLVDLKGRSIVVPGSQLEPAPPSRRASLPVLRPADDGRETTLVRTIDLHGCTAQAAVDLLDSFVNDALLEGASRLVVIHGRSGGRLKAAVHGRLAQLSPVRAFRLDPANPGVTIVEL